MADPWLTHLLYHLILLFLLLNFSADLSLLCHTYYVPIYKAFSDGPIIIPFILALICITGEPGARRVWRAPQYVISPYIALQYIQHIV